MPQADDFVACGWCGATIPDGQPWWVVTEHRAEGPQAKAACAECKKTHRLTPVRERPFVRVKPNETGA